MTKTILVLGGTGLMGAPVAYRLKADGFAVRVMARDPQNVQKVLGAGFTVVSGDATNHDDVDRALAGCHGAHLTLSGAAELPGAEHVAALATGHGLERISYISGATVCEQNRWFELVDTKLRAEAAIAASGIPYTIFCPTWPMEMLKRFLLPEKVMLMGAQPCPLHWFAVDDLARMVSVAYQREDAAHKRLYVHGPEAIPMKAALEQAAAVLRPEVKKVGVLPIWLMRLIATLTRNEFMANGVAMMAYFNKAGELGDPSEANRLLGAPTTTLTVWLATQAAGAA
jgi:uncharacterized protein YbjT (DUF2867 family)